MSGPCEHFGIGIGRSARCIARMAEQIGRAPEQLNAGFGDLAFHLVDNRIELFGVARNIIMVGHRVHIMEAIEGRAHFREEIKRGIKLDLSKLRCHRLARFPWAVKCARAKDVIPRPSKGVPIAYGPAQMIAHRFAQHFAVSFVIMEGERVGAFCTLKFHGRDIGKIAHSNLSKTRFQRRVKRTESLQPVSIV